jgi:hypothetical protein
MEVGLQSVRGCPLHSIDEAHSQKVDVEDIDSVTFFPCGQEVKQQGRKTVMVEALGYLHVAGTQATGTAAVRERDQPTSVARHVQGSYKSNGRNAHVANLEGGLRGASAVSRAQHNHGFPLAASRPHVDH